MRVRILEGTYHVYIILPPDAPLAAIDGLKDRHARWQRHAGSGEGDG